MIGFESTLDPSGIDLGTLVARSLLYSSLRMQPHAFCVVLCSPMQSYAALRSPAQPYAVLCRPVQPYAQSYAALRSSLQSYVAKLPHAALCALISRCIMDRPAICQVYANYISTYIPTYIPTICQLSFSWEFSTCARFWNYEIIDSSHIASMRDSYKKTSWDMVGI